MKPIIQTFFLTGTGGIFGGTTAGIAAFLTMLYYGGNQGCFAFVDALYGLVGYESCGLFGATTGIMLGAIVGAFIAHAAHIKQSRRIIAWLIGATIVLPWMTGIILFWPEFNLFFPLILPLSLMFIAASAIPALLTAALLQWHRADRKQ